jgi:hypothetical protein
VPGVAFPGYARNVLFFSVRLDVFSGPSGMAFSAGRAMNFRA